VKFEGFDWRPTQSELLDNFHVTPTMSVYVWDSLIPPNLSLLDPIIIPRSVALAPAFAPSSLPLLFEEFRKIKVPMKAYVIISKPSLSSLMHMSITQPHLYEYVNLLRMPH